MPVESRSALVLGVNDESEGRRGGAQRTLSRVHEKGGAESTAAKLTVDGQTADAHGWNEWIARQPPDHGGRKLGSRNAARSESVIGGDAAGGVLYGNEAVGDFAADVLSHLGLEIPVESRLPTIEYGAIMRLCQHLYSERSGHEPNNLRCRLAARRRAALGAGGWRMASANRR
jgi:hypothetical protein